MSIVPIIKGADAIGARLQKKDLQHRTLEPTPENRALVAKYDALAKKINEIPARAYGLKYNYRKRDLPMAIAKLTMERETLMIELLEMEKILFPK